LLYFVEIGNLSLWLPKAINRPPCCQICQIEHTHFSSHWQNNIWRMQINIFWFFRNPLCNWLWIFFHLCSYLAHYLCSQHWHSFWMMIMYFDFSLCSIWFDFILFCILYFVFLLCFEFSHENFLMKCMNELDLGWH